MNDHELDHIDSRNEKLVASVACNAAQEILIFHKETNRILRTNDIDMNIATLIQDVAVVLMHFCDIDYYSTTVNDVHSEILNFIDFFDIKTTNGG